MKSITILALSLTLATLCVAQAPPSVYDNDPVVRVFTQQTQLQEVRTRRIAIKFAENRNNDFILVFGTVEDDCVRYVQGEDFWLTRQLPWSPEFATLSNSTVRLSATWQATILAGEENIVGAYLFQDAFEIHHPRYGQIVVPASERIQGEWGWYGPGGEWRGVTYDQSRSRLWAKRLQAVSRVRALRSGVPVGSAVPWSEVEGANP